MKKKSPILIVIILVIIAAVFAFLFVKKMNMEKGIKLAIDETWNELKNESALPDYMKMIDAKTSYEIVKIEKEENNLVVHVTVEGIDLGDKLSKVDPVEYAKFETEEEINDFLLECIEASSIFELDTVLYARKDEAGYRILYTEEFVDAMNGKVYSYTENVMMNLGK